MSRVLRRPMFRGGYVDSEGTGITSGLDEGYTTGGRVGYQGAGLVSYGQKEVLESMYGKDAIQNAYQKEIDRYKKNIKNLQARTGMLSEDPESSVFISNIVDDINRQEAKLKSLQSPEGKTAFEKEKINEFNKIRQSQGLEFLTPKEEPKIEKEITGTGDGTNANRMEQTQESDTDVMNRYMEMFKANLAADKDELKSQRYFELAKFGLNLLSQPGGPPGGKRDLLGAVGRAGVPAIEGLSRISAEEKAAERQAKILGFQAALRELENPTAKKIQTLSKITGIPESEIAKRELSAGQSLDKTINLYAQAFEGELGTSPAIKLGATMAASGINLSEISKLPKDKNKNIESNKLKTGFYYDEEGVVYRFKNGQLQPIIIKSGN